MWLLVVVFPFHQLDFLHDVTLAVALLVRLLLVIAVAIGFGSVICAHSWDIVVSYPFDLMLLHLKLLIAIPHLMNVLLWSIVWIFL